MAGKPITRAREREQRLTRIPTFDLRWYQEPAWDYLTGGGPPEAHDSDGKHAELVWHRRAGKDEIAMHFAAREMMLVPATYWHMLPLAGQVRKAIWDAVNPATGKRRIDEAFPEPVFSKRETDMFVRCEPTGATWQCLGSDNFQGSIGSPPRGIVYSEWALANPSARGYLRPIIAENRGWQIFITTPRGKNHAYTTYQAAKQNPRQYAEMLTVHDTGMLTPEQLIDELQEYVSTYGEAMGLALYEQEYECSFDAAILGAYYGEEFKRIDRDGRITRVEHDPKWPVHVALDIGYDDDTAIWWFQVIGGEIRVLEYYYNSNKDADHYCSQLLGKQVFIEFVRANDEGEMRLRTGVGGDIQGLEHRQEYQYGSINLPHDAEAKTFAAKGKSVHEQFASVFGWGKVQIVPQLSREDGIQAGRKALHRAVFDSSCMHGIEALRQYHREWDDDRKAFRDIPYHDWTSHPADAWRYLAVSWSMERLPKEDQPVKWPTDRTFDDMLKMVRKRKLQEEE